MKELPRPSIDCSLLNSTQTHHWQRFSNHICNNIELWNGVSRIAVTVIYNEPACFHDAYPLSELLSLASILLMNMLKIAWDRSRQWWASNDSDMDRHGRFKMQKVERFFWVLEIFSICSQITRLVQEFSLFVPLKLCYSLTSGDGMPKIHRRWAFTFLYPMWCSSNAASNPIRNTTSASILELILECSVNCLTIGNYSFEGRNAQALIRMAATTSWAMHFTLRSWEPRSYLQCFAVADPYNVTWGVRQPACHCGLSPAFRWREESYLSQETQGTYLLEAAPIRLSYASQSLKCGLLAETDVQNTANA